MTKRKADMALVAEALGLPLVAGETTGALAKRCADRAAELVELVALTDVSLPAEDAQEDRADPETDPPPPARRDHKVRPRKAKTTKRGAR